MKHGLSGNKLNRQQSHRKATMRDIAKATILCQRICTTKAKAKEARKLVEQLITMGKKGTLAHKRQAFAVLQDHALVSSLFGTIAPLFAKRAGGYTRIIPWVKRRGDNAEMVFLELTEKRVEEKKEPKTAVKKSEAVAAPKKTEEKKTVEKKTAEKKAVEKKTADTKVADKKTSEKKGGVMKRMFGKRGE
ncbi:MAG: 50S ribosomal protein L17 [Candidatus Omnitrophica bacterium]|nr:50S ribosomal protein L17 [Candidatus Omnitrophota bacterium]